MPPAPAGVTSYPANNAVQLSWPTVAGATSYNLLRSTTSGGGYATIASGVTGPMCGSGPANAVYVDNTTANGTTYYYVVQSVNPVGASGNRIVLHAVNALRRLKLKRAIATECIGGGQGGAMLVETV